MYLLYSLLLGLGVLLLLPRFLFDAARHGKYAAGLGERAGGLPPFDAGGRPVLWLHCVSVGETQAARPLVKALLEKFPTHALVVSTTTQTGQRVAREAFGARAALVCYFPFDWAWAVRRALRRVNPSAVLLMETELWPNFLRECRRVGVPAAVVNGRLSEKSFRRYKLARPFIRRTLSDLSLALVQTEADAGRLRALGLAPGRVRVTGNVKFDLEESGEAALTEELRLRFGLVPGGRPLILAASTHEPEERLLVEAYGMTAEPAAPPSTTVTSATASPATTSSATSPAPSPTSGPRPRLLIAPRHPERFGEVAALLDRTKLSWSRRSDPPRPGDAACDAILLDSIGELRAAYPLAALVFVGGSLVPVGGHNVLEPALSARCVVTGPHTFNFRQVAASLLECDALVRLPELPPAEVAPALARLFRELLAEEERRRSIGRRARKVLEENRGATALTVELLAPLLGEAGRAGPSSHAREGAAGPAFESLARGRGSSRP
ncbi:MAG TPA: 3-deoxy-D-manno-octulosonic acid transferase [Pyrinomonadaceae bacterium]|nr:3-deoxy-D-manno-octulosonic acid transferase [Pyrinomonadaceae bacterium]